jgi:hypothetical protein
MTSQRCDAVVATAIAVVAVMLGLVIGTHCHSREASGLILASGGLIAW